MTEIEFLAVGVIFSAIVVLVGTIKVSNSIDELRLQIKSDNEELRNL